MSIPSFNNAAAAPAKLVVCVDDAPEGLRIVEAAVTAAGYNFLGASSGMECLALLNRVVPQLILMDIEMPDMDGFETCRRIRAVWSWSHVPVVFLTARHTIEDARKCIIVGGNEFIVKPFDIVKLIERVKHWTS